MVNITGMGFVAAEVENGLGRHRYYLSPGAYKKYLKYDYLDWAQVFLTLALCKISICLFLLRLSSFRRLRWWLHGLIVFLIVSHLPLFFLIVFQCTPIHKYWTNPLDGPGVCFTKATVETIIIIQGGMSCCPYWPCWPCWPCCSSIIPSLGRQLRVPLDASS